VRPVEFKLRRPYRSFGATRLILPDLAEKNFANT
jgi:hypothetical protein